MTAEAAETITVGDIFTDHMVIQRDKPISVKGTCSGADKVTVSFGGQSKTGSVQNGKWTVTLPAMKANTTPQTMEITAGSQKLTVSDILIGDVWFCSGQSNMDVRVKELAKKYRELYTAIQDKTLVRCINVPISNSNLPQEHFAESASWSVPNKDEVQNYSAYAYSFGVCLQEATGIPIGVLNCSCGGAMIQHWLSSRGLELAKISFPQSLHNAMANPLQGIAVKGILWYQGESNINDKTSYTRLFAAYAQSSREFFNDENLPIITTQLPKYSGSEYPNWSQFRVEQWNIASAMENVEIVCGIDLGVPAFNLHPSDKLAFGVRAGELALNKVYGQNKPGTSAYPQSIERTANGWKISFSNAQSGLEFKGGKLTEMSLVKKDGSTVKPTAEIADGSSLLINAVSDVVGIKYCMTPVPDGTFYTKNGLPVAPFNLTIKDAPKDVKATAPTSANKNDGSITGVTKEMEYRAANETGYKDCSGESISGLAAGTYYVRYKLAGDYLGMDAEVVVPKANSGNSSVGTSSGSNNINNNTSSAKPSSNVTSSVNDTTSIAPVAVESEPENITESDVSGAEPVESSTTETSQAEVTGTESDAASSDAKQAAQREESSPSAVLWLVIGAAVIAAGGLTALLVKRKRAA